MEEEGGGRREGKGKGEESRKFSCFDVSELYVIPLPLLSYDSRIHSRGEQTAP